MLRRLDKPSVSAKNQVLTSPLTFSVPLIYNNDNSIIRFNLFHLYLFPRAYQKQKQKHGVENSTRLPVGRSIKPYVFTGFLDLKYIKGGGGEGGLDPPFIC